jgi:hypothetical protein
LWLESALLIPTVLQYSTQYSVYERRADKIIGANKHWVEGKTINPHDDVKIKTQNTSRHGHGQSKTTVFIATT